MHDEAEMELREAVERLVREHGTLACAVAVHDLQTGFRFSREADRWFHAASTIKVAILLAVLRAVDQGRLRLDAPLHVRNRFFSLADQSVFKVDSSSDGFPQLYKSIGRTAKIGELAEAMITYSSNLATNLLLDLVGVEYAVQVLREAGVEGVSLHRGVDDERAFAAGINNEITAQGLLRLFAVLRSDFLSPTSRERAIHILLDQKFRSMIPARLPDHASVAHKTGEISTMCHDAGIVYLPEREPYLLAILTETEPNRAGRRETVAEISEAVYHVVAAPVGAKS
jgi:beta-lactamase class A